MNKIIAIIATLAALMLGALAIAHFAQDKEPIDQTPAVTEGDPDSPVNSSEIRGTVTGVDLEQAKFDGPYVVMVRQADGSEAVIAVPSMGIMLCAARDNIANVSDIKEGMKVEAKGALTAQGDIVPCESASHYLRIVK